MDVENTPPGKSLSQILNAIIYSFMEVCECDGGSIFTVKKDAQGVTYLQFEAMITRSKQLQEVPDFLRKMRFYMDGPSLVSKTAREVKLYNVTSEQQQKIMASSVDKVLDYVTQNILSAPLMTPRGDLMGVVQLVNKSPYRKKNLREGKAPDTQAEFDARDERLCAIVARQAALAIENSILLEEQERLLEGFVNACVTAVEARDSVTSGHSHRVSDYTVSLADAVSRTQTGDLKSVYFNSTQIREIRYAAMLHDIGKISVKEEVLNKEKKLHGWELELIQMRLKLMRANVHLASKLTPKEKEFYEKKLHEAWRFISSANEPSVLPMKVSEVIRDLQMLQFDTFEGEKLFALTPDEGFKLSIAKGSLTEIERVEIERHVTHTFEILRMVPWSRGLENVPLIAYRHHEKLDGTGYPCKCHSDDIPVQSRMLTICDIYDALTADDRPYKRSMDLTKALDILNTEVKRGKLDEALMKIFIEARIFELPNLKPGQKAA